MVRSRCATFNEPGSCPVTAARVALFPAVAMSTTNATAVATFASPDGC